MSTRFRSLTLAVSLALGAISTARSADAFCGFYVSGADKQLYNNATMVVMMREGTRTVLSMSNNYQGPPENFAMVVPVPVVLQEDNVKTLPAAIFDKVDQLAAPRLVEYWEQNPCSVGHFEDRKRSAAMPAPPPMAAAPGRAAEDLGVKVEAQFDIGEYQIVILSAKDATGLDTWLRQNGYKIPEGAEPLLKPYVQSGSKFFVAKVNVEKVRFEKGMAKLSPLRFHYDTDTFNLPVRLGLINASGKQDLIVHVLARNTRYELANYKNVTIPTNLDVDENAREQFGTFYAALFDRTLEENPGAVVTEYAWDASTCDPCPGPTLSPNDLATLGMDVMPSEINDNAVVPPPPPPPPYIPRSPFLEGESQPATKTPKSSPAVPSRPSISPGRRWRPSGFILTRLHARYGKDSLGEDLVFREAKPIVGGREFMKSVPKTGPTNDTERKLETGSEPGGINNFQGRYAIRHPWNGPMTCEHPQRGIWGGPPSGSGARQTTAAKDLAFAPRDGVNLASFVRHDVPEIHLKGAPKTLGLVPHPGAVLQNALAPAATAQSPQGANSTNPTATTSSGCGACAVTEHDSRGTSALFLAAIAGIVGMLRRRR